MKNQAVLEAIGGEKVGGRCVRRSDCVSVRRKEVMFGRIILKLL